VYIASYMVYPVITVQHSLLPS